MQLSRHSDYTLRVLLYLAVRPGQRQTLSQIATYFSISLEHLRKVVHQLSKMGYIVTYQGKGGGIELAHPAESINVGEVLERLEGGKPLIDCAALECRLAPACSLNQAIGHAQRAFFDTLAGYSLADLIASRSMVRKLATDG